ncbi:hypothetical protein LRS06_05610 [Hymenobacter sp. J193]|uniref:hypothetical protein n=1 Tax=Hymenobacter sp. J193 TaxID=2898429 RepID=UPI002151F9FE|nr:hypothetical protein [Hymenobacter sp. J193]MCR5887263.1 hypothetical protein [Hymenobacter sp. J193]
MKSRLLLLPFLTTAISCQNQTHAPADFAFRIDGFTDVIDTYENTFTRRGINQGSINFTDTTVTLTLTTEQKDSIYFFMGEKAFFSMPEEIKVPCEDYIKPSETDNLIVRANGQNKKVVFHNGCTTHDEKVKDFYSIRSFIYKIVYRNKNIKSLPKSSLMIL